MIRRRLFLGALSGVVTAPLIARDAAALMPVRPLRLRPVGGVPVGMVAPIIGAALPDGWVWCDGRKMPEDAYPELFATIGRIYGPASMHVPDLRWAPGLISDAVPHLGAPPAVALHYAIFTGRA